MKRCKACNTKKEVSEFHKRKDSKDGFAHDCKECGYSRVKSWRKNNPGAQAKLNKKWAEANRQKRRDSANAWNDANRDKLHASQKKYKTNNPDKFRAKGSKKRANKLSATPKWYDKKVEESIHKFNVMMEKTFKEKFHLDHIIPLNHLKVCGLHCEDNWQTLDGKTNILKSNKWDGTYDNLNW